MHKELLRCRVVDGGRTEVMTAVWETEEGKGLELLIDKIRTTKTNHEFLTEIGKAPIPGS